MNNPLSAFEHQDLEGALRHIDRGGTPIDAAKIVSTVRMLAKELGVQLPKTWPELDDPQRD